MFKQGDYVTVVRYAYQRADDFWIGVIKEISANGSCYVKWLKVADSHQHLKAFRYIYDPSRLVKLELSEEDLAMLALAGDTYAC